MESIRLTLNQVNFEEGDLEPSQELSSFSNLVAYDSPDQHDSGLPIASRLFQRSKGDEETDWLRAKSSLAELEQLTKEEEKPSEEKQEEKSGEGEKGDEEDEDEMGDRSTAFEPSLDSFKAFTDTVEALALQRSVIGGTSITPASPEEVAKAIAATQNKLTSTPIGVSSSSSFEESQVLLLLQHHEAAQKNELVQKHSSNHRNKEAHLDLQNGAHCDPDDYDGAGVSPQAPEQGSASAGVNIPEPSVASAQEHSFASVDGSSDNSPLNKSTSSLQVFAGGSSTIDTTFSLVSSHADLRSLGSDFNLSGSDFNVEGTPPRQDEKKTLASQESHERNVAVPSVEPDSTAPETTLHTAPETTPHHHHHRHDGPRQQLVQVPSSQIIKVTERSVRSASAGPIPTERIRPAELPPHAQSLVLPMVDDSPKRQLQVEEWLGLRPAAHHSQISSLASSQTPSSSSEVDVPARPESDTPPSDRFIVHSSGKRKLSKKSLRKIQQQVDPKSDSGSPKPTATDVKSAAVVTQDSPVLKERKEVDDTEVIVTSSEPTSPAADPGQGPLPVEQMTEVTPIISLQNTDVSTSVHISHKKTEVIVSEKVSTDVNVASSTHQSDAFHKELEEGFRSSKQAQQHHRDDIYRVSSETNLATSVEVKQEISSEVSVHTTIVHVDGAHPQPQQVTTVVAEDYNKIAESLVVENHEVLKSQLQHEQGIVKELESSTNLSESQIAGMNEETSEVVFDVQGMGEHSPAALVDAGAAGDMGKGAEKEDVVKRLGVDAIPEPAIEYVQLSTSAADLRAEPLQTSTPVKTDQLPAKVKKGKGNKRKTKEIHEKFRQKAQTLEMIGVNKSESECEKDVGMRDRHDGKEYGTNISNSSRNMAAVDKTSAQVPKDSHNADCDNGTGAYSSLSHSDTQMLGDSVLLGNNIDYLSSELERVLKEKVKLEGQLEMLEKDARAAMRDRAQLQAQLSAMSQQVRQQQSSAQGLRGDQSALTADLETLRQHRTRLEAVVVDAQRLLEEKDGEVKVMEDELSQMKETNERLHNTIQHMKQITQTKETTVQALKSKVAELYVDYQTTDQARILAEGEIKSLQSEVKSVVNAREWYQEQLHITQVAKHDLQQELSVAQTERIAQNTLIDRLKADNVRLKQQLADSHHRMIQEKEILARHLETIEADMVEREAAFQQLQSQREQVEEMLNNQDDAARDAEVAQTIADLQEELRKMKNDARRKDATIHVMEHEQADLVKRLTFSQESLLERDKTIESLEQKYVDAEVEVQKTKQEVHRKEEEMARLRDLKSAIEIELSLAREEKHTFDETLLGIKKDMAQVSNNFKQIKQEMQEKRQEIEKLNIERRDLREQIETLQLEIENEKNRVELKESTPSTAITHETAVLVHSAATRDKSHQMALDNQQMELMQEQQTRLTTELSVSQRRIADLEGQIQMLETGKLQLQGQVAAREVDQTSWKQMEDENKELKAQIAELHRQTHQEISKHKATAVKLGKDLENVQLELTQRQTAYEQSLEEAGLQMVALQKAKAELDAHLETQMQQHTMTSEDIQEHKPTVVESSQKQGVKSAEEVNRKLKAELTAEEVNRKLQDEMRRAVDHIEAQFKAKEAVMRADFEDKMKKISVADDSNKNLHFQMEEAQKSLADTKSHLNQVVDELELVKQAKLTLEDEVKELGTALAEKTKQVSDQCRKTDVAEETNKILKAEMQSVMMKYAESEPEKAEIVQRLTEEQEARVELESQLEATNARLTQEIEGKLAELQQELSQIQQQKASLEAQLREVVPREMLEMYQSKLDKLLQQICKDAPSNTPTPNEQSNDASSLLEIFFIKLSAVIDHMTNIHAEQSVDPDNQHQLLVSENSKLKEAVFTLSAEKNELTKHYDDILRQSATTESRKEVKTPLEEQVTMFMNRTDNSYEKDNKSESIPQQFVDNDILNANVPDVEKSIIHYEHRVSEFIHRLEISQEIKQSLVYELRVIMQDLRDVGTSLSPTRDEAPSGDKDVAIQSSNDSQVQRLQEEHSEVLRQNEGLENLLQEVQSALRSRCDELQQLQAKHGTQVASLQQELSAAQTEVLRLQTAETQHIHSEEEMRKMALDLEREKGRLAGILQSHDALRDHAAALEKANAELELKAADMSAHHQEELQTRDKHTEELMSKVEELQMTLSKEKVNVKEIKKQLLTEKGKHVKLRRQVESNWMDSDQMNVDLELKKNDLTSMSNELEKVRQAELAARLESERHRGDSHAAKLEVDRLRRELKDKKAKEPVLQESIQTLEWHVQQITAQLKSAQEQLASAEDRHQMEMDSVQATIQSNSNELAALRTELTGVKQERTKLQVRVAELKAALESGLTQAKMMKSQRRVNKEMLEKEIKTKMPPLPFDMSQLENLLAQATPAAPTSKSLSFLQETLSSLRGEISTLQVQVDDHIGAVQSSSTAWKELEAQVKDLRDVCKSSAAGRSESSTPTGPPSS